MIELLLAVQTIATAALAFFVITLRRELYPAIATAGPSDELLTPLLRSLMSVNVLVVETPQFEVSLTVTRVRWLLSEELFLKYSIRVYDVAMRPTSRSFYKEWKAWMNGDRRYDCKVEKPRWFAKIYTKAFDVVCFDREEEERKFREELQKYLSLPTKYRKKYRKNPMLWRKRFEQS